MRSWRSAVVVVCFVLAAGASPSWPGFCPLPSSECQTRVDLNCDGKDKNHCRIYDVDGSEYGDCSPNSAIDDFWTFFDGNFDGIADPCNPLDIVLMSPDGISDGLSQNPLCDRFYEDGAQGSEISDSLPLIFLDSTTVGVISGSSSALGRFDLIRGTRAGITVATDIDLGTVTCLADDAFSDVTAYVPIVDSEVPAIGRGFFYVARWKGGLLNPLFVYPYGYGECLERIVQPGNGDCPE